MSDLPALPHRFVFVLTYGRSGSTLVQTILNSIPGYCVRGENNNALFHIYNAWREITQARATLAIRRQKGRSDIDHPWYGAELIDPEALGRALTGTFATEVLNLPADTRVGGFKEIRWHSAGAHFSGFMRFLHAYFPDARVVVNTRNLDAVARSGWWAKQSPDEVKAVLRKAEAKYAAYRAEFPTASIGLHYDDYNGNPDAFAPLFEFLGERFDRDAISAILDTPLHHLKKPREQGEVRPLAPLPER